MLDVDRSQSVLPEFLNKVHLQKRDNAQYFANKQIISTLLKLILFT